MESKTIRMQRNDVSNHPTTPRYQSACGATLFACGFGDRIEVVITPVKSRDERLREARLTGLSEFFETYGVHAAPWKALDIIERVDAEFAKEKP